MEEKRDGDGVTVTERDRRQTQGQRPVGRGADSHPPPGPPKQLHSGLEPPCPPPRHSARALALAFLSHPLPQQGLPDRHPLLGVVVEPGSLGHLRQTGRVPRAVLLGDPAQGPSLSSEPLLGQGSTLTWGLTWDLDSPQLSPRLALDSLCPASSWQRDGTPGDPASCQASLAPAPGPGACCVPETHWIPGLGCRWQGGCSNLSLPFTSCVPLGKSLSPSESYL